jgi:hypothetical protein
MCDYSILVAFVFIIAYASLLVGDNRENIHNQTTFIKQWLALFFDSSLLIFSFLKSSDAIILKTSFCISKLNPSYYSESTNNLVYFFLS